MGTVSEKLFYLNETTRRIRLGVNQFLINEGGEPLPESATLREYADSLPWWSPAAIFADGEQGAQLEIAPEYLYQDAAGTNPVSVAGDPAGRITDLSGNGNHAVQTVSAARMTLAGTGPYWLSSDGVDDNFQVPLGQNFIGDFALILTTGPIFGSIDTKTNETWGYTVDPRYIPDGDMHALIVVDRALTSVEKQRIIDWYADGVVAVPTTSLRAWWGRTDLTSLDPSYSDYSQVTDANGAFNRCSSLTTPPDVSGWTQVTSAHSTFLECSSLTTPPDVSGWTQVTSANNTFNTCSSLTNPVDISNWNPLLLTSATNFMFGISPAGFDQAAYDAALIKWDQDHDLTQVNSLSIHFGSAKYTPGGAAEAARNKLVAADWIITDGGAAA